MLVKLQGQEYDSGWILEGDFNVIVNCNDRLRATGVDHVVQCEFVDLVTIHNLANVRVIGC